MRCCCFTPCQNAGMPRCPGEHSAQVEEAHIKQILLRGQIAVSSTGTQDTAGEDTGTHVLWSHKCRAPHLSASQVQLSTSETTQAGSEEHASHPGCCAVSHRDSSTTIFTTCMIDLHFSQGSYCELWNLAYVIIAASWPAGSLDGIVHEVPRARPRSDNSPAYQRVTQLKVS